MEGGGELGLLKICFKKIDELSVPFEILLLMLQTTPHLSRYFSTKKQKKTFWAENVDRGDFVEYRLIDCQNFRSVEFFV